MPTKVYKYGLLPPTAGEAVIEQQCDLAWRSAVARIRAYESYRAERDAVFRHELPAVAELAALREQVAEDRKRLKALRTGTKKPTSDEAALLRAQIAAAVARMKQVAPVAKEQRTELRASGRLTALDEALKRDYLELTHRFTEAGLFWGTRQLVEAAHDQRVKALDRLRVPETWGAVGIQFQGGIEIDKDTCTLSDRRITITAHAEPIPGRKGKPRPRLRLRIGRDDQHAEWPIIMHRPIPAGASIRHAKVVCERIAQQVRWTLHLTLNLPDVEPELRPGVVAVRPTFSMVKGSLITAEIADEAGRRDAYELHERLVGAVDKAHDLRSIRDKARDQMLAAIGAWMASGAARPAEWPATIERWESCDRLRQFVTTWWPRHRVDGDDEIVRVALAWAKQDAHLWAWERHTYTKSIGRRLHDYRVWAAGLAERYGTLVVPQTNYAILAQRGARPEKERELTRAASRQRVLAAPGLLRKVLIEAFEARGGKVILMGVAESPEQMLRERSSGTVRTVTARKARFWRRHARNRDDSGGGTSGDEGTDRAPLAASSRND